MTRRQAVEHRRERNRISAQQSRARRQQHAAALEKKVKELETLAAGLRQKVADLEQSLAHSKEERAQLEVQIEKSQHQQAQADAEKLASAEAKLKRCNQGYEAMTANLFDLGTSLALSLPYFELEELHLPIH